VQSAWPIHGSATVLEGAAYFSAGVHSEVDGGIFVAALDPETGEAEWEAQVDAGALDPAWCGWSDSVLTKAITRNDILSSDGKAVYLPSTQLDARTGEILASPTGHFVMGGSYGFLEDTTCPPFAPTDRFGNTRYWNFTNDARRVPKMPVHGGGMLAVYHRGIIGFSNYIGIMGYKLKGQTTSPVAYFDALVDARATERKWEIAFPVEARLKAVIVAKGTLFLSALKNAADPETGFLGIYSVSSAERLGEIRLGVAPKYLGLIAIANRLFVCTQDGRIICMGE
jgi:hypothetical protein